jgi:hypothetical protein
MEIQVKFVQTRETKNAIVFSEIDEAGNVLEIADAIVGSFYLKKSAIDGKAPDAVEITVKSVKVASKAKTSKTAEKPVKAAVKKTVKKVAVKKAA